MLIHELYLIYLIIIINLNFANTELILCFIKCSHLILPYQNITSLEWWRLFFIKKKFRYSLTGILCNPIILHQWSFIGYKQTSFFLKIVVCERRDFNWKNMYYYSFSFFPSTMYKKYFWARLSIYFSVEWVQYLSHIFTLNRATETFLIVKMGLQRL